MADPKTLFGKPEEPEPFNPVCLEELREENEEFGLSGLEDLTGPNTIEHADDDSDIFKAHPKDAPGFGEHGFDVDRQTDIWE
jgi:hypothetical protein